MTQGGPWAWGVGRLVRGSVLCPRRGPPLDRVSLAAPSARGRAPSPPGLSSHSPRVDGLHERLGPSGTWVTRGGVDAPARGEAPERLVAPSSLPPSARDDDLREAGEWGQRGLAPRRAPSLTAPGASREHPHPPPPPGCGVRVGGETQAVHPSPIPRYRPLKTSI